MTRSKVSWVRVNAIGGGQEQKDFKEEFVFVVMACSELLRNARESVEHVTSLR